MNKDKDKILEDLKKRVEQLEKQMAKLNLFKDPWINPDEIFPKSEENCCNVCGLKFEGPLGYVCNNPKCPSRITVM